MSLTVNTHDIEAYRGKPDKGRLIATYRGEPTDRVPNFEVLIEDDHVTRLLGHPAGNTLGVGGEAAKGADVGETVERPMLPEDYIALCRMIGQDCICVECMWTPIHRRTEDGALTGFYDRSLKSRKDLERIVWPGEDDMERTLGYVREYVRAVSGTDIGVALCGASMFQTLYEFVIGMHDCMIMTMEEPELLEELMERSADYYEELFKRGVAEDIDILFLGDDFAYNGGLFVPLSTFERIWRPAYERIMAPALRAGIPIKFHSDGKLDEAMEMLLEMGFSCINPLDPSGIDYRDYKKRYGHRVTLSGGIDLTYPLIKGTPEDVERFVQDLCTVMKPGGRWEAASSHSIVNYIPHENFVTMINAIHKYGRY
jgi:uroporphyrinogen-III decarboxylase